MLGWPDIILKLSLTFHILLYYIHIVKYYYMLALTLFLFIWNSKEKGKSNFFTQNGIPKTWPEAATANPTAIPPDTIAFGFTP